MKDRLLHSGLLLALGALPIVACGGQSETGTETGPGTETGTATDNQEEFSGQKVLLRESYSPTGELIVVEDAEGNLATFMRGRTDSTDHDLGLRTYALTSLEEIYRIIHPEMTAMPTQVHALSERLLALKAARLAEQNAAGEAPVEPVVPKTASYFYDTVCRLFKNSPTDGYTPLYCTYEHNLNKVCTLGLVQSLDKVFGGNDGPVDADLTLSGFSATALIQKGHWGWGYWVGSFAGKVGCLTLRIWGSKGDLGVTVHRYRDPI